MKFRDYLDESNQVNTVDYIKSYGKKPNGKGYWWFFTSQTKQDVNDKKHSFNYNGNYKDAIKKALKYLGTQVYLGT